jgi:colicin import membrane protein
MQQLLASLEDERRRQFRRFVAVSAALHVAFAVAFWVGPVRRSGTAQPAVVRVDLRTIEELGPVPKARPAPPAPKPKPPPPPPEAKKVLPKQPAPLPKPKPAEAKPRPEPKAEPKPKQEPAPEQSYEDVIAQLREQAGETKPVEVTQAPAGGPAGLGQLVSPEVARWMRDVKMHVTRAWILEPGFRLQALETKVDVDVGPSGEVRSVRITKSSGNPWYDQSVERAIKKASPLPPPPEADDWPFSFKPSDLL